MVTTTIMTQKRKVTRKTKKEEGITKKQNDAGTATVEDETSKTRKKEEGQNKLPTKELGINIQRYANRIISEPM